MEFKFDYPIFSTEFAIFIHHDMTGMGLAAMLMRRIIDYARKQGIMEIYGGVFGENRPMLKLCKAFGFNIKSDPNEPETMLVALTLRE